MHVRFDFHWKMKGKNTTHESPVCRRCAVAFMSYVFSFDPPVKDANPTFIPHNIYLYINTLSCKHI